MKLTCPTRTPTRPYLTTHIGVCVRLIWVRVGFVRSLKPCTDVASNLFAIDLRLNVRIACDGLQQKFRHAEYFTCNPLISQSILILFSNGFHCYSQDFISFPMIAHATW